MGLDCIILVVYLVLVLVDMQQMDHRNILADKRSLEYDLKRHNLLVYRKFLGKDRHICY